jgi:putative transposase
MPNHVHMLVTADDAGGQYRMMQALGRRYVRYFNDRHGRSGTLWEGRFKASLVDSDAYLLTCMRYIELNPVRAGLCSCPGDYPWSSYSSNVHGHADPLVSHHSLYVSLAVSPGARRRAYRDLFHDEIEPWKLRDIRRATRQQLPLGAAGYEDGKD